MSNGYRTLSQHLNDLKKENFSLKLRIYFLEERIERKYEASSEDIYKRNIELKVELESLKQELWDKQQFHDKSWYAAEGLSTHNDAELHYHYEEKQQEMEQVQKHLQNKIQLLQEEIKLANNEAARMTVLADNEKKNCFKLTRKLKEYTAEMTEARILQNQYCVTLADKDKVLQQLTQLLDSKDGQIQQLLAENQNQRDERTKCLEETVQELAAALQQKNLFEKQYHDLNLSDVPPEQRDSESQTEELMIQTLQDRLQQLEAKNKMLQDNLDEMKSQLLATLDASQQHDCTIQNLNETLSSKIIEAEEMDETIEEQTISIDKLQAVLHQNKLDHFQMPGVLSSTQPQVDFFNLQYALFCTQLESQKVQRTLRRSERQLTDARLIQQLLRSDLKKAWKQKEAMWTHNENLHVALLQMQVQLQDMSQQLEKVREQKDAVNQEQDLTIQHLNETLLQKEQLLQEHIHLLQYQANSEKGPRINDLMLEKLQERIGDRDKALEQAIDEKYRALEEREHKLRQLQLAIREKENDLERLSSVLSRNEETMNSLDCMLKSKELEIGHTSTMYKNLQWLMRETEEKYKNAIKERESFIQQLQASLHERHKELETIVAGCPEKSSVVKNELFEQLQLCLQNKEKMIQDILRDKNQQMAEHEKEIIKFLKTVSTRDQLKEEIIERGSDHSKMMVIVKNERTNTEGNKDFQNMLEKELANANEEFQIVSRKEKDTRAELCSLQTLFAKQNEDLHVQAADVDSLTRNIQIKEELIKDLQVQLVNPEDVPVIESLTHEVLKLREKVSMMELHDQEGFGNRSQELVLLLERLVTERARLNNALLSEREIYSNLLNLHSLPKSCEESKTLQLELEAVRMLRGRLEEAWGQSLQQLSSLEAEKRAAIEFGGGDRASFRAPPKHAF